MHIIIHSNGNRNYQPLPKLLQMHCGNFRNQSGLLPRTYDARDGDINTGRV